MTDRRKTIGLMLLLTILGTLMMLPPLVYVFSHPVSHFGIPQIVFYLFVLWLLMIVGTALLARAIPAEDIEDGGSEVDR